MPPTLTPATERFHPYSAEEVIRSNSLDPKRAAKALSILAPTLKPGETFDFISEANGLTPLVSYIVASNTHFYAGTDTILQLSLPLSEVEFSSKRNLNSWSRTPDTLVVHHGNRQYKLSRVPTPNHAIFQEFVNRARLIAQVTHPQIFEQLATARETAHPDTALSATPTAQPAPSTTAPAPHDMSAAIDQLKQLSELREAGALSPEEFDRAKTRLGF